MDTEKNIQDLIQNLKLIKHPEGGYYREIYRSNDLIPVNRIETLNRYKNKPYRCFSTSIYYLLVKDDFSAFHRIQSDEIWHFYEGSPIRLHLLNEADKSYETFILGQNYQYQFVVPKQVWFSAEVVDKNSYALLGCTVSLGFEFDDFELAKKEDLKLLFPHHIEIINRFCKE